MFTERRRREKDGFLLFEALIAILVASTAIVVIMNGIGSALKGVNMISRYFEASVLAEARIELLAKEPGVKVANESGRFSSDEDKKGIFSWEKKITQIRVPTIFGLADTPLCEVVMVVKWKEKANEKGYTLVTYLPKYEESPPER